MSALSRAVSAAPEPDDVRLIEQGLGLLWLLAQHGKAKSFFEQLSDDEREIVKETAIRAGYKRLADLRGGAKRGRATLTNNLINVMVYAAKESSAGLKTRRVEPDAVRTGDGAWDRADWMDRSEPTYGHVGRDGLVQVFDRSEYEEEDDRTVLGRREANRRGRYVSSLEQRFEAAVKAGRIAPLKTEDEVGRRFAVHRYWYRKYDFETMPQVDHLEMEQRLALVPLSIADLSLAARGTLKRQAESEGGSPEQVRRNYNRLRKQRSRADKARPQAALTPEEQAALDALFERLEFPLRARRVLVGHTSDDAVNRYKRASRGLIDAVSAVREAGHSSTMESPADRSTP